MGSDCPTCHGTGLMTPKITNGEVSTSKLAKVPCDNPACTVNRIKATKLNRNDYTKFQATDTHVKAARALISVMPEGSTKWQYSLTAQVTDAMANNVTDKLWEAAHQMIDDGYHKMKMHSVTIDDTEYSFKVSEQPECGRLTTERKPKEQPTVTPEQRAALEAVPFDDPQDDKPESLATWFPRPNDTINPDADNAPNVANVKPTAKPLPDHGLLKVRLFNLLNDTFGDPDIEKEENKRVISYHLKTALNTDTFDKYMTNHLPEDASIAVDTYIQAELARRAKMKPSSPVPVETPAPTAAAPAKDTLTVGAFLSLPFEDRPLVSFSGYAITEIKVKGTLDDETVYSLYTTESNNAPFVVKESALLTVTGKRPQPAPPRAIVPRQHAESPVTCYPSPRGEVVYKGVRYDVSFREGAKAETALELLSEWDRFWQMGAAQGIQRADMQQPITSPQQMQPATNAPTTPAQPASDGGEVTCVMISVGTSFEGQKPQLEFMIDGDDRPMRYTQPIDKMVQLLASVRKMDGTPFTAADLTTGRKFPGVWKIAFRPTEKNGKQYKNVVAVKSAA